MNSPDWEQRAACRPGNGYQPDLWFPHPTDRATRLLAESICHEECPVRTECGDTAEYRREPFGVWGGHDVNPTGGLSAPRGRPPKGGHGCGTVRAFKRHLDRGETPCQACREAANAAYAAKYAKSLRKAGN